MATLHIHIFQKNVLFKKLLYLFYMYYLIHGILVWSIIRPIFN